MTLIPNVYLKKADGSPLKVNFHFENGLPVKPIIENSYKFGFQSSDYLPIFVMILKNNDNSYKDEKAINFLYEKNKKNFTLWIIFDSFYVRFNDIKQKYRNFYFGIINEDNEYLQFYLIESDKSNIMGE